DVEQQIDQVTSLCWNTQGGTDALTELTITASLARRSHASGLTNCSGGLRGITAGIRPRERREGNKPGLCRLLHTQRSGNLSIPGGSKRRSYPDQSVYDAESLSHQRIRNQPILDFV